MKLESRYDAGETNFDAMTKQKSLQKDGEVRVGGDEGRETGPVGKDLNWSSDETGRRT